MSLTGKRVIIFAENEYEDLELHYPLIRLTEAGATCTIVGTGSAPEYRGKHGLPAKVDKTIDQVSADDYDGVVIPGGWAPDRMRRYPKLLQIVRDANRQNKPIAAICHAGWVLASAEIIEGRRMTCVPAIKDDVRHAGAEYIDAEVVRDRNLITSRVPADLPAFCRELIAAFEGR